MHGETSSYTVWKKIEMQIGLQTKLPNPSCISTICSVMRAHQNNDNLYSRIPVEDGVCVTAIPLDKVISVCCQWQWTKLWGHRSPTLFGQFTIVFLQLTQQEAFEKCWVHSPLIAAARPFTRCCYWCRLHIDVHDDANDDNDDNAWQRGPLWPHGMGPTNTSLFKAISRLQTQCNSAEMTPGFW